MSEIQLPKPARQGPWPGDLALYSESQMRAMYQQGYAAALSQTAGVDYDEVWLLLKAAQTNIGACRPDWDADDAEHWDRLTAAMESVKAASIKQPGSINRPLVSDDSQNVAASVSERARELLAAQYRHDPEFAATIIEGTGMDSVTYALRAITAALTQQRGEDVESAARALFEAQADPLAASWDRQWGPTKEHWRKVARGNIYTTTPQPSADAVRELVKRAYEVVHHDDECPAIGGNGDKDCQCDAVPFLRELESLLSGGSHA